MNRILRPIFLFLIVTFTTQLGASTLSVVSLGNALQNPELILVDPDSETYAAAVNSVTNLLLNKPEEAELAAFRNQLSDLAEHRDTRVGKLFFSALAATPAIENLPEGVAQAGINVSWPLALGASIRVRGEYTKVDETWLISEFEVTVDGVAGAPISGMAPYFGKGEIRPLLLDLDAIDYLLGRNPEDRRLPESERKPFDYDAALRGIFEAEEDVVGKTLETLNETVAPTTDVEDRKAALQAHLATRAERQAVDKAGDDLDFWKAVYTQLKEALILARPAAMPVREGSTVRVHWVHNGEKTTAICIRMRGGNVAVRDKEMPSAPLRNNNEEGNGSGN